MAYDEGLAERLRERLAAQTELGEQELSERKMFGGLAFLLDGHMAVAAGDGGILLRCDPADLDELLQDPAARPMVMQGREMKGWLHVDLDAACTDAELDRWIGHGVRFVRSIDAE